MTSEIESPAKRSRLAPRKNPYWRGVSGGRGGVSLGYRRVTRGAGAWVAKITVGGQRVEERIGVADDHDAPHGALGYKSAVTAALDWSRRQHEGIEGRKETGAGGKGPTVRSAVDAYVKVRKARSAREGRNAEGRLQAHVLADKRFADGLLSKLRASTIEDWRSRLPLRGNEDRDLGGAGDVRSIAPSTVNRLLNDLRAALNAAAVKHRRELPSHLPIEIKVGTKAISVAAEARKQLLTDTQVRSVIDAAFEWPDEGDFGRLVLLAAATGARHSQLASLRIEDLQIAQRRIMMPGSRKGRSARARLPVTIPLAADVMERLLPATRSRDSNEPLLLRWAYRNVGPLKWERDYRRPWGPAYEVDKAWAFTIKRAGVPDDTVMYALRHSSIVRGLRGGLPVRLVAALHDTSSEMIERHYSAYITDATEEIARRASLSL